jgi:Fic family protein
MFTPQYTITSKLLANIKRINLLVAELNNKSFPKTVLVEFERYAREISAFASTSIEGNPLPLTEVKKILKNKPTHVRDSEREVLNYNQALKNLSKRSKSRLSHRFVFTVHRWVMQGLLPAESLGKYRVTPVGLHDPKSGKVMYLPPDAKDVPNLMSNLLEFVEEGRGELDPLILAGIFHKQFVVIHPFPDGNGRTTRLLTKLLLKDMGLNTFNLFSFENYYNQNLTRYFANVGLFGDYYELQRGEVDFTRWLEFFTEGITDELLRVGDLLSEAVPNVGLQSYHLAILRQVRKKGKIKHSDYAKLTKRARATRALDLKYLVDLGLIERCAKGKATYYELGRGSS